MSKQIKLEIKSLISELKIEVHQCDCCKNSDQSEKLSETLKTVVSESLKEVIENLNN